MAPAAFAGHYKHMPDPQGSSDSQGVTDAKARISRRRKWRRAEKSWQVVTKVADTAVELGPLAAVLRKSPRENPLGWILFGLAAGRRLWQVKKMMTPPVKQEATMSWWPNVCANISHAVLQLAERVGVGDPVQDLDILEEQRASSSAVYMLDGIVWGVSSNGYDEPSDDPTPILDALWDVCGEIELTAQGDGTANFKKADARPAFEPTTTALRMIERCKAFRAKGYRVAVLADGRPGTGKSYAVRHTALALGGRILHVTLTNLAPWKVGDAARMLRPDAVILDDVDRSNTSAALRLVEQLLELGVAVLCTSNDRGCIAGAFKRAGRVDMRFLFAGIDPDVLDVLLTPWPVLYDSPDVRRLLKHSTVAEVERFIEHYDTLGLEEAVQYLQDLADEEDDDNAEAFNSAVMRLLGQALDDEDEVCTSAGHMALTTDMDIVMSDVEEFCA